MFFTLRIFAGGMRQNYAHGWLLAFSIFFFFSLAAVKRQGELVDLSKRNQLKAVGRGYHINDVLILSMAALASGYLSVLVMALYINSPTVVELYTTPDALWGICVILLYWQTVLSCYISCGSMHDDPILYIIEEWISRSVSSSSYFNCFWSYLVTETLSRKTLMKLFRIKCI